MADDHGVVVRPLVATLDGETIEPLRLGSDGPARVLVGRGSEADWRIPDRRVSRAHAMLVRRGSEWFLADHHSQHGTYLNGVRLAEGEMLPLSDDDEIALGPWLCRWEVGGSERARLHQTMTMPMEAAQDEGSGTRISTFLRRELEGLSQQRITALLATIRRLVSAASRDDVARVLIDSVSEITAASRIHVVRQLANDTVEFLGLDAEEGTPLPAISRSLLRAAKEGGSAQLHDSANPVEGVSVMQLEIRSALCTPIMVNGRADCYLYLDSRRGEERLSKEAVAFCAALADIGGLSIERALSAQLAGIREQMERDLRSARSAQELLLPAPRGVLGALSYAYECIPGRKVAGDLFDVLALPDGRVAFWLGDVTGKGIGAGLLMAATQMQMRALLRRGAQLAEAMQETNANLCERTDADKFVTMLAGMWSPADMVLELIDAGHGSCCLIEPGGTARCEKVGGGMPLGVIGSTAYESSRMRITRGTRLVTFSDGLIEQRDAEGREFGLQRAMDILSSQADGASDVRSLMDALRAHTPTRFNDDLTIASITLGWG